jgi:hypothetical protein
LFSFFFAYIGVVGALLLEAVFHYFRAPQKITKGQAKKEEKRGLTEEVRAGNMPLARSGRAAKVTAP